MEKDVEPQKFFLPPKETEAMEDIPKVEVKHTESGVSVVEAPVSKSPIFSSNPKPIIVPPQVEQIRPFNNLFLPVSELEDVDLEHKGMGQYNFYQEDPFSKNNEGLSTKPYDYHMGEFGFNENFDYSAE